MLAVVVDRTFTPGSVDMRSSLFTDPRRVILFFACLIFAVGLDREIILTAIFSRSTVTMYSVQFQIQVVSLLLPLCNTRTYTYMKQGIGIEEIR